MLSIVLSILLAGCGAEGPEGRFERYTGRLEGALDSERPPAATAERFTPPTPPRPGQLQLDLQGSKLDALDFLALSGCEVQVTIGKRNSSLGRMASPSQRLLLELEYLQLAPACVDRLQARGRETLAALLNEAWQQKRGQLPSLIFNATLAGVEYRDFWNAPARLGDYPAQTSSAVISALESINASARRWLAGDYRFDNLAFELLLSEIATGDGGALLKALALQAQALDVSDRLLVARRDHHLARGFVRNPGEKDILRNVVTRFFIGELQPWMVTVDRRRQSLLPAIRELEALLDAVLPGPYREWREARDAALADYAGAPRRHVASIKLLRAVLEQP